MFVRRSIGLLAAAAALTVGLAACGGNSTSSSTTAAKSEPKIAVILGGLANDGGFNEYAADAAKTLQSEGKAKVQIRESVATAADAEPIFRAYANQGYDLVIGWGLGFSDAVFTVAKELPKTHFVATGSADILGKATANVETWTFSSSDQGYLEGWVAGKTGLSPVAGVDGISAPFNLAAYQAFSVGLKAANPKAVELKRIFTGSWENPQLASQATKAQINLGAKLIVTGAEGYTSGVISAAKAANVATIGATNATSTDAKSVNVGLVKLDWTPTLRQIIDRVDAGTFGKKGYTSTIANEGLVFSDLNHPAAAPALPADISAQIDQLAKDLASGKVTIPAS